MERFAGRYALLRRLGQGGMGSVHLALDLSTTTECALKRLDPRMLRVAPHSLRHEFELLARVRHPAVVGVYELGFAPDGTPFYTMEYCPGDSADKLQTRGDWDMLFHLAARVTEGLEALHGAGIVHGDLKPSNILVLPGTSPGAPPAGVRLVDFGLAALLGRDREGRRGTRGFAAPEVVRGEAPGVASDLYGLGATLYTMAVGQTPFAGRTSRTALHGATNGLPSSIALEDAGVPEPLVQLVLRLMAPAADERPADAREVRRELERIHPGARLSLPRRLQTEVVVGRERELARIERLMTLHGAGPRVVMLAGEPGVGKSSLLGELAVRSTLQGRAVFRLSCAGFDAPAALAIALLRRLAAEYNAGADGDDLTRRALAVLDSGEAPFDDAEIALLADAAAEWGLAIERRGATPLVLLDDGERLDASSRAVVRRIALHPRATAFRWVWTDRNTVPSEEDRVLIDARHAHRVAVGPLDREGAGRLVAARLHGTPPDQLCEYLWNRTGGHPGLLVEFLHAAAERGALKESEVGLSADPIALDALALPVDFEQSLLARMATLGPEVRAVAGALAVWERPATLDEIRAVLPAATESATDRLVGSGFATRDDAGRVALCPPGLVHQLLVGVDPEERRRLHRSALAHPGLSAAERFVHLKGAGDPAAALVAAAEALAIRADERLGMEASALAETVAPEHAAEWQERAGRLLLERGRHRAAIPYLEKSLESQAAPEVRAERWYQLSRAYLRAGRPEEVGAVIERALAEHPSPRYRSLLLHNEASRWTSQGELDTARATAEQALALAGEAGDAEATGFAALTLGGVSLLLGQPGEARTLALHAEDAFARSGHALGRTRALGLRAAATAEDNAAEARALFEQALAQARRDGLRLPTEELLMSLATLLMEDGQWSDAREAYAEAARIALEDGRRRGAALALANLAQVDGLTGRAARARRQARSAIRLTHAYLPRLEPFAWRSLAQAERIAGRVRAADRAARKALAMAMPFDPEGELDWCRIEYGRLQAADGRWREAEDVWSVALATPRARGSLSAIVLATLCGRAAVRRRDLEAATTRLTQAEGWRMGRRMPYAEAHLQQLRAETALVQGRIEVGADLARATLDAMGALPDPAGRAAAGLDFARIVMNAGQDARVPVGEWLHESASAFERLGDRRSRVRALALTVEWFRRHPIGFGGSQRDRGLIQSVSRLLDSLADMRELTQRAMQMAVEQLDAERGILLLANDQTGNLEPVVEHGTVDAATRDKAMGYSRKAVERVAKSGGSLLITDAPSDPEASDSVLDLGLRSIVCVPLFVAAKVVGAVYLDDSRRPDAFSEADRGLLEGFAHLMAVAIEKSRGHEEVVRANELLVGENLSLRREVGVRFQPRNFIGMSSAMQQVMAVVERAAHGTTTVLLTGENGTGKELIARILHHSGKRRLGSFVAVNCGAIPESLLESELFGILPNVATGVRGRDGRFVQAHGGTLFLDEIGEMPVKQQVALLAALANREITPVGGGQAIPVDVRIIAATNQDLRKRIEEGAFRVDLFYRLNVIPIEVPPLRERKADIPSLAQYFATHLAQQQEREVPQLSPELLAALMGSDWPGNVRELQNYVERVMAMTPGNVLRPLPMPQPIEARGPRVKFESSRHLATVIADVERQLIREALDQFEGNQSRAARALGLPEQTLRYRLRKYAMARARRYQRPRNKRR